MNSEESSLDRDSRGNVTWNNLRYTIDLEGVRIVLNRQVLVILVGVDRTVFIAVGSYREKSSDQRIARPVQQPGGQAMMLRKSQPIPFIRGQSREKTYGALLEQPQDVSFIFFAKRLFFSR